MRTGRLRNMAASDSHPNAGNSPDANRYRPEAIEAGWQRSWQEQGLHRTPEPSDDGEAQR